MDAKKAPIPAASAFDVLEGIDQIHAAMRGKKVVHLDLRTKPSRDEIKAVLIGPSGRLRAPTMRVGRTLLVGFDEEMYRKFL